MSEKIVQNATSDYMLTQAFQETNAITRALAHTCAKALKKCDKWTAQIKFFDYTFLLCICIVLIKICAYSAVCKYY